MHIFNQSGALIFMRRIICLLTLPCLISLLIISALSCGDTEAEDVDDANDDEVDDDGGDEVICGVTFNESIKPFFDDYCLRCHSVNASSGQRNGAPAGSNYDTQEDVLAHADKIRERLLDGGGMPPTPPEPTHIERDDAISWIDCALNQQGS